MRRSLLIFLAAGAVLTLLMAWFAYPGHILKSQTRLQQRLSYLLAPGLATGLALATFFRSLVPSLSNPATNPLTWLPIAIAGLAAVFVQSSAFGLVIWVAWRIVSEFRPDY